MTDASGIWGWVPAIGGLVLAAVLLWALLRNLKTTPREEARTERATRELRDQLDREGEDAQSPR